MQIRLKSFKEKGIGAPYWLTPFKLVIFPKIISNIDISTENLIISRNELTYLIFINKKLIFIISFLNSLLYNQINLKKGISLWPIK